MMQILPAAKIFSFVANALGQSPHADLHPENVKIYLIFEFVIS